MAYDLQSMCRECPLKQMCFQWTDFEKESCKVYQARNVVKKQLWEEEDHHEKGTD